MDETTKALPALFWLLGFLSIAIGSLYLSRKYLTETPLKRFFGVLLIGTSASMVPYGPFGLLFGFPSVLTASILAFLFLDKRATNGS